MDKKNLLLGTGCLALAFGLMLMQANQQAEQRAAQAAQEAARDYDAAAAGQPDIHVTQDNEGADEVRPLLAQAAAAGDASAQAPVVASKEDDGAKSIFSKVDQTEQPKPKPVVEWVPEETYVLENEYIRVTFTDRGGAVRQVEFIHRDEAGELDYPMALGAEQPYAFNVDDELPALAIGVANGNAVPEEFAQTFKMLKRSDTMIQFVYHDPSGVDIIRGYQLQPAGGEGEPYSIEHETRFVNKSSEGFSLDLFVNLGAVPPTETDIYGDSLNFGYFARGDAEFIASTKLVGAPGFLGIGKQVALGELFGPKPNELPLDIEWASVKNQFFAGVLTPHPSQPASGYFIDTVEMDTVDEEGKPEQALRGRVRFNFSNLPAGEEKVFAMQYYVGPKEYIRLQAMGGGQDKVMQLAPDFPLIRSFALISKILLSLMLGINTFIPNWGFTIILLTIFIKLAMWPLTAIQVKSAKRMSQIQAPLKELREKYKDNPQVMQKKTMELFRQHRVNPAAGCLPLFVQLPIFLSLFYTLRTASELRFADFLWVTDLASADTISWLPALPAALPFFGGPIHILPLLMTVTMVFQMRMTPTPTSDDLQRKVIQFMPVVFLLFCYRFPAGLVLYWTCQNLLTILQQWLTNRAKDEPLAVIEPEPKKKSSSGKRKSPKRKR